jgi:hypothetical protein
MDTPQTIAAIFVLCWIILTAFVVPSITIIQAIYQALTKKKSKCITTPTHQC